MSSQIDRLKVILLPLSIRKTLARHRLTLEDVLDLKKIKDILSVSALADLIMVQNSIYQLLPYGCRSARFMGESPARAIGSSYHVNPMVIDTKKEDNGSGGMDCCYSPKFELYSLYLHYSNVQNSECREYMERKVHPSVRMIQASEATLKQFYLRMFQNNQSPSDGPMPISPLFSVSSVNNGDISHFPENDAFAINFIRENFAVVTFDEKKFPNEEEFNRLVVSLLETKHRYSNYETMVSEMSDLFTFYLRKLHEKII